MNAPTVYTNSYNTTLGHKYFLFVELLSPERYIVRINGSVNLAKPFLLRNKRVQIFTAEPFCS